MKNPNHKLILETLNSIENKTKEDEETIKELEKYFKMKGEE